AALAVTQPKYAAAVRASMDAGLPVLVRERDPGVEAVAPIAGGCLPLSALFVPADPLPAIASDPTRPVSVQYTSGTTSRPKGVVWTHANALWAAKVNAAHAGVRDDDVTPVFLPLFHTNAIGYSTLASLWSGGTIVLQPRFSASRFWDIARRHRCTWANMIGFTIKSLISREAPASHDFRFWACASDVAPIRALWGIKTIGWWGMTETVSHGIVADRGWPNAEMGMGHAAAEYGVRVLSDDGEPVLPGGTGKLQILGVRGLSLFLEYLDDPAATAAAFTGDGWLDTGDMVTLTPSGDLFFAEREKDMLKIGGENVAASEIERVLMGFPGVVEAAVVGRPDEMLDEVAVAFIVAAPGIEAAAVVTHCAAQLADFKVPRAVHFLDELPKGTLDKVLKRDLRARLV
ncbi:MAG TPA: AMP-binding protein, partial [Sphingopyxis sp.]|nr:AMP-binding protein [Sphingopyxis sp.]